MKRFIYTPDVTAFIQTEYGIFDVSQDIINGSVTRNLDAASTATLTLQNRNRKYLRKMKPMDRIVIYLTRTKPVLVFSGYLDRAPLDQLYPGPVTVNASCTLKRLLYTYWDPSLEYTMRWFQKSGWTWDIGTGNIFNNEGSSLWNMDVEGSIGHVMRQVMHDVGNWPIGENGENRNTVHILALPQKFLQKTQEMIATEIKADQNQRDNIMKFLQAYLTVSGIYSDPFTPGLNFNYQSTQTDDNPLPANLSGAYQAKIYGPPVSLSGYAGAIKSTCASAGINLSAAQASNAATIYSVVTARGYNLSAAAGFISAAFAESSLIATRIQNDAAPSNTTGIGLFQLTGAEWWGSTGNLANAIRVVHPDYNGSPVPGGPDGFNAEYNTLGILSNSGLGDAAIATVNNSADPLKTIVDTFERPLSDSGDLNRGGTIFNAVLAALKSNPTTTNPKDQATGLPGDVIVGNPAFESMQIQPDRTTADTLNQYTFRISGNPYGDDTMIFRAVQYDAKLTDHEIRIYVPGAADRSTPQAAGWKNKSVSLETSINRENRFPNTPASANKSSVALIDPSTVTTAQLTHGGVSTAGLKPAALWGLAFIQEYFGPFQLVSGYRPGSAGDHGKGLALDLVPVNKETGTAEWSDEGVNRLDALAKWAGWTPHPPSHSDTSGADVTAGNAATRYIGWRYVGGHGPPTGYDGSYPNGYPSEGSGAHLHISFQDVDPKNIPTTDATAALNNSAATSASSGVYGGTGVQINQTTVAQIAAASSYGQALTFPLVSDYTEAVNLSGERALQNDVPLMDWVKFMCTASGRRFQSMPNGDFLAFYPDYFNWSGEGPYWNIYDIETQDLTIDVSDESLATHVFTIADTFAVNGAIDLSDKLASTVASVESIATFSDVIAVSPEFNAKDFLMRYGARPFVDEVPEIKNSLMQFMRGWMTFMTKWAAMFYATPTFTFMPELYPGSLIEFHSKDLVMFVESVTHSFDRGSGFTTTATLTSPSTHSGTYDFPMVLSGYSTAKTKGNS